MSAPASALRPLADCLALDATRPTARQAGRPIAWAALLQLANEELVSPAVYSRLDRASCLDAVPFEEREYLSLLHRLNGERNAALRDQALQLAAALNRRGIRPLWLKGAAALFADVYEDRAARMVGDIDILVPRAGLADSLAVLADLGYGLADQYPAGHHAYGEFMRAGDPGAVDLHIEPIDAAYLLPADEMWAHAVFCPADGVEFFVPAATDRLLHNVLHAQIHHRADYYRGVIRVRQLYDGAMIANALAPSIDWPLIEARLRAHRLETALQSYLLAARDLFGLAWPLAAAPTLRARAHFGRCLLQRRVPALGWGLVPWANLRHGFAWHRMRHLYGSEAGAARRMLRHAGQFARKARARGVIAQLLRG